MSYSVWEVASVLPLIALILLTIWGAATDQPDMVEEFRDMQHYANLVMKDQRKHATITALENGAYCKNEALSAISRQLADHIEGLCNMLEYWVRDETTHPHYQRHMESIEYGRKRARRLRDA